MLVALRDKIEDQPPVKPHVMLEILTLPSTAQNECKTPAIPDHIAMPLFREALEFIAANGDFICEVYAQDWESRRVHYGATAKAGMTHGAGALHCVANTSKNMRNATSFGQVAEIYAIREISQVNEIVTVLETACFIVVAGFVGMRISEIGPLKSGCLSVQKSNRGLTLFTVHGLLFKTSREEEGVPWQWVAGWDGPEMWSGKRYKRFGGFGAQKSVSQHQVDIYSPEVTAAFWMETLTP